MVASSIAVEEEESVSLMDEVNSGAYVSLHNAQIFEEGLSFSGNERNKTWLNIGERFVDLSDVSGADIPNDSRASLACDFDDDGDVDLFVHSIQRERHALFRNDALRPGKDAGFLKLKLKATTSQYEAIGARVIVHGPEGPLAQVLSRGAGFLSCQADELVFGLGDQEEALVEVHWPGTPGDAAESFGVVPAGTRARLVEGRGRPEAYGARPRPLPDPELEGMKLSEGELFPRVALFDRGGRPQVFDPVQLAGGHELLVTFWASYCTPCVKEIPELQRLHMAGELRVAAISLDVPGAVPEALRRLERGGAEYPAFFLGEGKGDGAEEGVAPVDEVIDLERMPLPTSLVLSSAGRVQTVLRGALGGEE